jgi:hypothetical protein
MLGLDPAPPPSRGNAGSGAARPRARPGCGCGHGARAVGSSLNIARPGPRANGGDATVPGGSCRRYWRRLIHGIPRTRAVDEAQLVERARRRRRGRVPEALRRARRPGLPASPTGWRGRTTRPRLHAGDVRLAVYQRLGQFRGDSAFGTWLHAIAVSVSLNGLRRRRARRGARGRSRRDGAGLHAGRGRGRA